MRLAPGFRLLFPIVLTGVAVCSVVGADYYVATSGSDTNPGTVTQP